MVVIISCQKDDLNDHQVEPISPESKVSIYLQGDDLKSSKEIVFGDTIEILRDLNVLVFAETEENNPVQCYWKFAFHPLLGEEVVSSYYGDQVSHKLSEYGLYHVTVALDPGLNFIISEFYLLTNGIPGRIGDSPENNSIFRIEKRRLENGYLHWEIYFKYYTQLDNGQGFVEYSTFNSLGDQLSQLTFDLTRSIINPDYFYFVMPNNQAAVTRLAFMANIAGEISVDLNNWLSSFNDGVSINFTTSLNYNDPNPFCGDPISFMYNGEQVTYWTVESSGRCWLDRNLGASRVPISGTDSEGFGDLFQWGRLVDEHQLRSSGTINTLSSSDVPGHDKFITAPGYTADWRSPQNNNLWQGVNGINNPCPHGWRVPTMNELLQEINSWSNGSYESPLKWPLAGQRNQSGTIVRSGVIGSVWSSTAQPPFSLRVTLTALDGTPTASPQRAVGASVRCIRED